MAHGNDPSLPHEVAACTTLEVVYEGCTAALACQPISSSAARCRAVRLCPGAAAWSRANRYSAVIAGSSNETRSLTAMNVPSSPPRRVPGPPRPPVLSGWDLLACDSSPSPQEKLVSRSTSLVVGCPRKRVVRVRPPDRIRRKLRGRCGSVLAVRRRRADDRGRMTLRFLSPQTAAVAGDVSLLDLLSEFIDANADTVCLITGDRRTELEWLAHCDYLRALQRLGHETLARDDQRVPASPLALTVVSGLGTALTGGRTAALLILRGPARAAHALRPTPIAQG